MGWFHLPNQEREGRGLLSLAPPYAYQWLFGTRRRLYNHRLDYRGVTHRFNPDDVIALYDDIITRQRARIRVMIFPISA